MKKSFRCKIIIIVLLLTFFGVETISAQEFSDEIKIKENKIGNMENSEMGLYWDRHTTQRNLYTDVQEICEKAFGNYLSPLQGLTKILNEGHDKPYRTDKQTAVIGPGYTEFYIFLNDKIALVTIEDAGETYNTYFRILHNEERKNIKVLEVPPPGGIGIAGTKQRPENQNYDPRQLVTAGDAIMYSKADIQLVFHTSIQKIVEKSFDNYVQALQGLYTLTEQEGHGNSTPFRVSDVTFFTFDGNLDDSLLETTVIRDNYCEFTLSLLDVEDRARVTIKKDGNQYITTFRLLKEGEYRIQVQAG